MICSICSSIFSEPVNELFALPSVTSDCRPWTAGRSVRICEGCGVMQRVVHPLAVKDFSQVYDDYSSYPEPMGRTKKILEFVSDKMPVPQTILDIGGGNGYGMKVLSEHFSGAEVSGYEPYAKDSKIVTERPAGKYDLITLFQVLEHIEDVHEMLSFVKSSLTENGHVLIQVPYAIEWPFDLLIADHWWHFTKFSLALLMLNSGFKISYVGNDVRKKELTLLASVGQPDPVKTSELVLDRPENWIISYKSRLDSINQKVAIYGTGPAAAWAGHILAEKVMCYLDEDDSRPRLFNGRKVYRPHTDLPIVAPFPDWQLSLIKAKHQELKFL